MKVWYCTTSKCTLERVVVSPPIAKLQTAFLRLMCDTRVLKVNLIRDMHSTINCSLWWWNFSTFVCFGWKRSCRVFTFETEELWEEFNFASFLQLYEAWHEAERVSVEKLSWDVCEKYSRDRKLFHLNINHRSVNLVWCL